MKSKQITINKIEITVHSDGSISKPNNRFNDKRIERTLGTKNGSGYMTILVGKTTCRVHRLIAQAFLSDFNDFPEVDHVDGNRTNNDISNLRMLTGSGNMQAHQTKKRGCSSKYRGVCWSKGRGRWRAYCRVDGRLKSLGNFDTEREAAMARDVYAFSQGFPKEGLNFSENY